MPGEIAFVDLGELCGGCCARIAAMLQTAFPAERLHRYGSGTHAEGDAAPPRMVIVRGRRDQLEDALQRLPDGWAEVPVLAVCCSGRSGEAEGEAPAEVDDFATCPVRSAELIQRVRRLLENEIRRAAPRKRRPLETLVGTSPVFLRALDTLALMARSEATVVLSGETGTGKELFARAIHYMSPRMGHPFIPLNCGSVPDHLLENELFGHVRGAYTDAGATAPGLLQAAEGGTLFLDEVDALTPAAQVKLLRFLQDREYRPLGSPQPVTASVRIVAATNAELEECVRARLFRPDLYHRLNVLSLCVPPLRERMDDVPRLAEHFLSVFALRERRGRFGLSARAMDKLMAYHWPGNVRQLEGVLQRAVILAASAQIQAAEISIPVEARVAEEGPGLLREAKARAIAQFERSYLTALLAVNRGNLSRAAKQAGKERRSFQRLLQKHSLARESFC